MKACKLTCQKIFYPSPCSIKVLIYVLLGVFFLNGCGSSKQVVADNPASQRFGDETKKFFRDSGEVHQQVVFLRANKDSLPDLAILNNFNSEKPQIELLINNGLKGFQTRSPGRWIKELQNPIRFLAAADLNLDGGDDLILIIKSSGKVSTQVLFNNKKGYFYAKQNKGFHLISPGIKKVIPFDIDQDGDRDLFYFGRKVLNEGGKLSHHQARVMINKGDGNLEDLTALLLPGLPSGIKDVSFADYNGDGVVDIFLAYVKGQNRLLINNGVGKFSDYTMSHLPRILDDTQHVDWADFDGDGDNDLLVANRTIERYFKAYPGETTYFLENTGGGHFKKRSHKILPRLPSYKSYLLDANGNTKVDGLILTSKGVYYLQGRGKWQFSDETERRLPRFRFFKSMAFSDLNKDGFLDLFALSPTPGRSRVWLNSFN